MNIFVLDENPKIAAQMMNDKHVVKMPLESLQMISTCMTLRGFNGPYRKSFAYHPCTIWARQTSENLVWLIEHFKALCEEYTLRYNKVHKCQKTFEQSEDEVKKLIEYLPKDGLTPFAIAISPDMFCRRVEGFDSLPAVDKYRLYYLHDKKHIADWKTKPPQWWTDFYKMEEEYGLQ